MFEIPRNQYSIIFDLDGTLVDSESTWRKAMDIFMEEIGLSGRAQEVNHLLVGLIERDAMQTIVDTFDINSDPSKLSELRLDIVRNLHATESDLFDGSRELLHAAEKSGMKTALATSSDETLATYLLARHGLRPYFDVILTAHDVTHGKPDPEIFLSAARLMNQHPQSCVVIEDSPRGLEAARAAGMKAIAVKHNGVFSDEELLSKNPVRLLNGINELCIEDIEAIMSA